MKGVIWSEKCSSHPLARRHGGRGRKKRITVKKKNKTTTAQREQSSIFVPWKKQFAAPSEFLFLFKAAKVGDLLLIFVFISSSSRNNSCSTMSECIREHGNERWKIFPFDLLFWSKKAKEERGKKRTPKVHILQGGKDCHAKKKNIRDG